MRDTNLIKLAKFLAKGYFPKKSKVITGKEILKEINCRLEQINTHLGTDFKSNISESQLRDMINFIRANNLIVNGELLATGKGYYISDDLDEIEKYTNAFDMRVESQIRANDGIKSRKHKYKRKKKLMVYDKKVIEGDLFDAL